MSDKHTHHHTHDDGDLEETPFVDPKSSKEEAIKNAPTKGGLIPLKTATTEELDRIYNQLVETYGEEKVLERASEIGTYENILFYLKNWLSSELNRETDSLDMIPPENIAKFARKFDNGEYKLGPSVASQVRTPEERPSTVVDVEQSIVEMMATRKGSLRNYGLYGSGINVYLRAPQRAEIGDLVARCRITTLEYGRMFGAHYYLYFDLILKECFIDFVLPLIVNSSLVEHNKEGALLKAIKLTDFNYLMGLVLTMMYPEGYDRFTHICTRGKDAAFPNGCSHVQVVNADITKMLNVDFASMSPGAIAHMAKMRNLTNKVTLADLDNYQRMLGFNGKTITFDNWRFTLGVPSLYDYLACGEAFNAALLNEVTADNTRGVYSAFAFREMSAYLPWVVKMESLDQDTGDVLRTETNRDVVSFFLNDVMKNPDYVKELRDKIIAYINHSQLAHLSYPAPTCPICKHTPETKTGFVAVEAQNTFFTLAWQK